MKVARVVEFDENYWEVTEGDRWYSVKYRPDRKTISGQWFICNERGRELSYWARTGQGIVSAVKMHEGWDW